MPRSLRGRLLAVAVATTALALALAGVAIAGILERYVIGTVDARLDDRLAAYGAAVRPDGTIDAPLVGRLTAGGGAQDLWRIATPAMQAGSPLLDAGALADGPRHHDRMTPPSPPPPVPGAPPLPPPDPVRAFDARLANGQRVHGRWTSIPTTAGPAQVAVAVSRRVIDRPVDAALAPLLAMLALLGALLAAATLVQLRIGLRPLGTIGAMLAEVRAGHRRHVAVTEPTELLPLVDQLNALIDENADQLARARSHVANLAHGLKTPLAALRLDLAGHDADGRLAAQLDRAERQIRHHLGRARAASDAGAAGAAVPLAPVVADLVAALARIHADRMVVPRVAIDPALTVRCDAQDLAEILGNLIDNGWRWARTTIAIEAARDGAMLGIVIADDGPGIAADAIPRALRPGVRLDEAGEGHGFGLPIARELAELHGGELALGAATGGGLRVTVTLPAG